jgi:hypothetical protein
MAESSNTEGEERGEGDADHHNSHRGEERRGGTNLPLYRHRGEEIISYQ